MMKDVQEEYFLVVPKKANCVRVKLKTTTWIIKELNIGRSGRLNYPHYIILYGVALRMDFLLSYLSYGMRLGRFIRSFLYIGT